MSRSTHDRTDAHTGVDSDLIVLLESAVGSFPAGTDLHTVLEYIHNWISLRENQSPVFYSIPINAIIQRTVSSSFTADARITFSFSGSYTVNAITKRTESFTFTADAIKLRAASGSYTIDAVNKATASGSYTIDAAVLAAGEVVGGFTIDSVVKGTISGSFTIDAVTLRTISSTFTIDSVVMPIFTIDAEITSGVVTGLTTIQLRSIDQTITANNILPNTQTLKIYKRDHNW